jgi:hypothetical protein
VRGMSERLAGIGGRLSLGPGGANGRGFQLVATVPETRTPASGDVQRGDALNQAASAPDGSAAPAASRVGAQPG